MLLSSQLRQQRAAVLDRLQSLSDRAATEGRELSADESATWDAGMAEARDLEQRVERQQAAEAMQRQQGRPQAVRDERGELHTILRASDKLYDRLRARGGVEGAEPPSLARALRGALIGDYRGLSPVERALGESTLPGGGYAVPQELSALWIDAVRANTVCIQAGVGTLPMQTQTLRVAEIVTGAPAPTFRAEGTAFGEGDIVLGAIDLRARTIGAIRSASVELLADSPMASDMLLTDLTRSMAVAIDAAMLNGDGNVVSPADNPKGILNWTGINAVAGGAITNYDWWMRGLHSIEVSNLAANAVIDHPDTVDQLRRTKTGLGFWDGTASAGLHYDQTTLVPPAAYSALQRLMTTSMPSGTSLEGDFAWAAYGMREEIIIEATRIGSDPAGNSAFSKGLVHVRAYMRLDCATLQPKAFSKITGLTYT